MAKVTTGWLTASQERKIATPSSPRLSAQLLKGSGLAFTAPRVEALALCELSATPPATRVAASRQASGTCPRAL